MGSLLRANDVKLADLISDFLDEHFYKKNTENFERVNDKARQVAGIDTIFEINGQRYLCDEKNGGTRINTNLRTFSLELSFINRNGERQIGWFLNEGLVNDSYMFIWTDKADTDKPTSIDEIHEVEIAVVRKSKIKEYLEEKGISMDRLRSISDTLVNNPNYSMKVRKRDRRGNIIESKDGKLKYEISGLSFCHSTQLYEQPVNIILPRETYRQLADVNMVINV